MSIRRLYGLLLIALTLATGPAAAVPISGQIRQRDTGAPLPGGLISISRTGEDQPIRVVQSLQNGSFVLRVPSAGHYELTVDCSDCLTLRQSITVPAGGLSSLKLLPSPVPSLTAMMRSPDPRAKALRERLAHAPADLAREREALAHLTQSPPEIRTPIPPREENAAPDYIELTALFQQRPVFNLAIAQMIAGATPETEASARRSLVERQDVMDLIHRAADRRSCVFPQDGKQDIGARLPQYETMRTAERLLAAESWLMARDGRILAAVDNEARGYRIAAHIASDPLMISYLVAVACDAITTNEMSRLLSLAGPDEAVAEKIQRVITANRPRLNFRRAQHDEFVAMARQLVTTPGDPIGFVESAIASLPPKTLVLGRLTGPGGSYAPAEQHFLERVWEAVEAQVLHDACQMASDPDIPSPGTESSPQVKPATVNPWRAAGPWTADPVELLAQTAFPGSLRNKDRLGAARAVVVRAAAAVLAYRSHRGTFPAHLKDAAAGPWPDLYSNKPLRYRREGKGFVVYSVGPDGGFDGGRPGMETNHLQAYFRYP